MVNSLYFFWKMANKRKRVDIVSIHVESLTNGIIAPTFYEVINNLTNVEISQDDKLYEFRFLNTNLADCVVGLVETTQDKDIPPIKNKQTKEFSQVRIDTNTEGLAFANIFLFDTQLKVLIYEVNRNGCYLQTFKQILEEKWATLHDDNQISVNFSAVCRFDEYNRMLQMNNYRKICYQICCPTEVLRIVRQQENSLSKSLLESQLSVAEQNNINIISIEQKCMPVAINRNGMQAGFVREFTGLINAVCGAGQRQNINKYTVQGYTLDPESERMRSTTINLLADVFDEYISIPEVQIQSSLQVVERKTSIEALYNKVHNELTSIIAVTR